jgi:hypothetical protein
VRRFQGSTCSTIGLVSSLALVLAGCSVAPAEADEIGVCINPKTEERIEDDRCSDGSDGWESDDGSVWFWYGINSGHTAPPVGQKVNVSHGHKGGPGTMNHARGGVPKAGSTISKSTIARGGFGAGNAGKGSSGG